MKRKLHELRQVPYHIFVEVDVRFHNLWARNPVVWEARRSCSCELLCRGKARSRRACSRHECGTYNHSQVGGPVHHTMYLLHLHHRKKIIVHLIQAKVEATQMLFIYLDLLKKAFSQSSFNKIKHFFTKQ